MSIKIPSYNPEPSIDELALMLSTQEISLPLNRRRPQQVTEVIHVPTSEHVAQIVGKNGYKIKNLRSATQTCIKTPIRGDEPMFTVSGNPENVKKASDAIKIAAKHFSELMQSRSNACAVGEMTILVPVPQQYVGVVVGKNGTMIMRIKEQTRTRINTPKGDSLNPSFEVTGTKANVEAAKEAIMDRVRDALNMKSSVKFDPDLQHKNLFLINQNNVGSQCVPSAQCSYGPPPSPQLYNTRMFARVPTPLPSTSIPSPNYFSSQESFVNMFSYI